MPRADVVAVIALRRIAGGGTEVPEVPARVRPAVGAAGRVVLVVPDRGVRDRLHRSPRRIVGLGERSRTSTLVLLVPEREHRCVTSGGQLSPGVLLVTSRG